MYNTYHFSQINRRESFFVSGQVLEDGAEESESFDPTAGLDQSEL